MSCLARDVGGSLAQNIADITCMYVHTCVILCLTEKFLLRIKNVSTVLVYQELPRYKLFVTEYILG
jgi:hypothetical protein